MELFAEEKVISNRSGTRRRLMLLRVVSYNKTMRAHFCIDDVTGEAYTVNLIMDFHEFGGIRTPSYEKFIGKFVTVRELKPLLYMGTKVKLVEHKQIGERRDK